MAPMRAVRHVVCTLRILARICLFLVSSPNFYLVPIWICARVQAARQRHSALAAVVTSTVNLSRL